MTTVFVATTGGHLAQLHSLADRIPPTRTRSGSPTPTSRARRCSPTATSSTSRTSAAGRADRAAVHAARPPAATGQRRPTRAVSTGSGIALGYLPYLAARGVECHYIESAARVSGPSLTGRILRWVPGVRTYTQYRHWSGGHVALRRQRVRRLRAGAGRARSPAIGSGSSSPWARPPSSRSGGSCSRWRSCSAPGRAAGAGHGPARRGAVADRRAPPSTTCRCTPRRSCRPRSSPSALAAADIVVSHAGTGSALANLAAGRFAVMVSRAAEFGEAGDDHQRQLADELAARGLGAAPRRRPRSRWRTCSGRCRRRCAGCPTCRRSSCGRERACERLGRRLAVDPVTDPRWRRLAEGPRASLFTSPPWISAVCRSYGFAPEARIAVDAAGEPVGGFAWVAVDDVRGRRLSSLPFSDRADPLVPDSPTWTRAVRRAEDRRRPAHAAVPRRLARASPTPGCATVGEAAWHGTPLDADARRAAPPDQQPVAPQPRGIAASRRPRRRPGRPRCGPRLPPPARPVAQAQVPACSRSHWSSSRTSGTSSPRRTVRHAARLARRRGDRRRDVPGVERRPVLQVRRLRAGAPAGAPERRHLLDRDPLGRRARPPASSTGV